MHFHRISSEPCFFYHVYSIYIFTLHIKYAGKYHMFPMFWAQKLYELSETRIFYTSLVPWCSRMQCISNQFINVRKKGVKSKTTCIEPTICWEWWTCSYGKCSSRSTQFRVFLHQTVDSLTMRHKVLLLVLQSLSSKDVVIGVFVKISH